MSTQPLCPTCNAVQLQPPKFDLINSCSSCGTEFFQDTLGNLHIQRSDNPDLPQRKRKLSKPPPRMTSTIQDDQLIIEYRGRNILDILKTILYGLTGLTLLVGIIIKEIQMLLNGSITVGHWIGLVVLIVIGSVGNLGLLVGIISLAAWVLEAIFNRKLIFVAEDSIQVEIEPFNKLGFKTIVLNGTLQQLRVRLRSFNEKSPHSRYFELVGKTQSDARVLVAFPDHELTNYVQVELANYLALPDEAILPKIDKPLFQPGRNFNLSKRKHNFSKPPHGMKSGIQDDQLVIYHKKNTCIVADQDIIQVVNGKKINLPVGTVQRLRVTLRVIDTGEETTTYYDLRCETLYGELNLVSFTKREETEFVQAELVDYLGLPEEVVLPINRQFDWKL